MNRRGFISGMAGILASGFAPAVVGSGILMPVRKIVVPRVLPSGMEMLMSAEIGSYEHIRFIQTGLTTVWFDSINDVWHETERLFVPSSQYGDLLLKELKG